MRTAINVTAKNELLLPALDALFPALFPGAYHLAICRGSLLPQYFAGATKFLEKSGKSHIKHTRHKDPVSEETVQKMKNTKIWKLENEFYNFAVKQFNQVKTATLEQKQLQTKFYNYEKVRPK